MGLPASLAALRRCPEELVSLGGRQRGRKTFYLFLCFYRNQDSCEKLLLKSGGLTTNGQPTYMPAVHVEVSHV